MTMVVEVMYSEGPKQDNNFSEAEEIYEGRREIDTAALEPALSLDCKGMEKWGVFTDLSYVTKWQKMLQKSTSDS